MVYEGEYLNGKRNGKGKEYDNNGILKFESEYLNDKRKGKGKEYDNNGILKFESEYLNDKRNGKGKEYDNNGKLKFEGEYLYDIEIIGKGYDNFGNILYKLNFFEGIIKKYNNNNGELISEDEHSNLLKIKTKKKQNNGSDHTEFYDE